MYMPGLKFMAQNMCKKIPENYLLAINPPFPSVFVRQRANKANLRDLKAATGL